MSNSDNMIIHDIHALAENLNVHDFEPLSCGIGLGELQPMIGTRKEPSIFREGLRLAPAAATPMPARVSPRAKGSSWPVRGLLFLVAHVIDIFVVASTLATGICLAVYLQHAHAERAARREALLRLTHHIGTVKAVLVVYAVFGLYWVLFQLLSEGTLGHIWRRKVTRQRLTGNPYPGQNK